MWKKAQYSDSFRSIREKIIKFTEQLAHSAHLISQKLNSSAEAVLNRPTKEPLSAKGRAKTMRRNEIILNRSLPPGPRHYPSFINLERKEK